MNEDENKVFLFLKSLGYNDIIYEPDGNQPPDFLINKKIAVEARRLNQFFLNDVKYEPLENLEYSLEPRLKNLFKSFQNYSVPNSAFVLYNYNRPLKTTKDFMTKVKNVLEKQINRIDKIMEYNIDDKLYIKFFPSEKREDQVFLFGSKSDRNKGGFVITETQKSLTLILNEKTKKIEQHKHKYKEWWLALVNCIYLDIDRITKDQLKEGFQQSDVFKKIYIISQLYPIRGFEL